MFTSLLQPEIQEFIHEHTHADVTKLALQKNPFPKVEWTEILNQIAARQKAENKLPTWFKADNIIFPSKISVEQTSSETAAEYKSGLVRGNSLIDMTGGFGVDDFYFAKDIERVTHCELNANLSAIAKNNFTALNINNIDCIAGDSLETLKASGRTWSWMYIDPSRRNDAKGKVFMLKDCLPNVPELLDTYFNYTDNVMVKTAPLLDITAGLGELKYVKAIHIVAVNNEVKELLWILEKGYNGQPISIAVNINKSGTEVFKSQTNNKAEAFFSLPQKYLYEPNAAIMKSGAFNEVSNFYNLGKLHNNTQLYTSNESIDFAGRRFIIDQIVSYQKTDMRELEGKKMNISTRNFPLSPLEIQKKWKIKDGGDTYAFFTTNLKKEKVVLLCSKA